MKAGVGGVGVGGDTSGVGVGDGTTGVGVGEYGAGSRSVCRGCSEGERAGRGGMYGVILENECHH